MSIVIFQHSLYCELLESISSLYGQRLALFSSPDISWKETSTFEERFEADVDALLVGGEQALEICRQQSVEGDAGELHAAVCLFCRQGREGLIVEVLEHLDLEDHEKLQALVDALKYELPNDRQGYLVSLLRADDEQLCSLAAAVTGYRRIPAGRELTQVLGRRQSAPVIRALGRLRERSAVNLLLAEVKNEDEAVSSAALWSLLRMGGLQAIGHCLGVVAEKPSAVIPLALCGGRSALPALLGLARPDTALPGSLLALGLLGESTAAELLMAKLGGECAEATALALNLLTGAELYERVFIPDEVDEDELFPEELEAYKKDGKVPAKPDGTPYGEWVTRLSQNPQEWSEWWAQNGQVFQPGIRYRNGTPFSPASLLENLQHEKTPHKIRQLAYEELVIRYDVDFPFEADMRVSDQLKVLDEMAQWVAANSGRFQSGEWYFAGHVVAG